MTLTPLAKTILAWAVFLALAFTWNGAPNGGLIALPLTLIFAVKHTKELLNVRACERGFYEPITATRHPHQIPDESGA